MAKEIFHYGSGRFSQVVAKSVIEAKLPERHMAFRRCAGLIRSALPPK